mmetsp:Transcript_20430/g.28393  ORF Transcript_20430/g.28393 Transcript_20430/m.28393 type:complete len:233 (-) Transcript_20430:225-923(-)
MVSSLSTASPLASAQGESSITKRRRPRESSLAKKMRSYSGIDNTTTMILRAAAADNNNNNNNNHIHPGFQACSSTATTSSSSPHRFFPAAAVATTMAAAAAVAGFLQHHIRTCHHRPYYPPTLVVSTILRPTESRCNSSPLISAANSARFTTTDSSSNCATGSINPSPFLLSIPNKQHPPANIFIIWRIHRQSFIITIIIVAISSSNSRWQRLLHQICSHTLASHLPQCQEQ